MSYRTKPETNRHGNGRGRISQSGLTQDIEIGSCVFQCDVPHPWIAQRQVGPMSVSAAWHSCVAAHWLKYHCYKQASRDMTSDVLKATLNPNKPALLYR